MRTISLLGLATVSALALAPSAFAQDAASGTASGKHWAVVGGGAMLQPKDDGAPGIGKVDGGLAPTVSGSYFFNDNLAVELWGAADTFNHRVGGPAGKIGTVEQQPVALSAQYHFGPADAVFRPFAGVGYYVSNFTREKIDGLSGDGSKVALDDGRGAIGTVGLDMNINPTWFARVDARYLHERPDLRVAGAGVGQDVKLDPWTVGFGIGARF